MYVNHSIQNLSMMSVILAKDILMDLSIRLPSLKFLTLSHCGLAALYGKFPKTKSTNFCFEITNVLLIFFPLQVDYKKQVNLLSCL
jgi:hypothetical protein